MYCHHHFVFISNNRNDNNNRINAVNVCKEERNNSFPITENYLLSSMYVSYMSGNLLHGTS